MVERGRRPADAGRWRVPAALVCLGAIGLGVALPRSRTGRGFIRAAALGTAVSGIVLARKGRPGAFPGDRSAPADCPADPDRIDVVIPARDEAHVIGDVISDLGGQEPAIGFLVTVVDDRSSDDTGRIAQRAVAAAGLSELAVVLRRTGGIDGKAAALAAAAGDRLPSPRSAILVLDADARVPADFIARTRAALAAGPSAISARRHVLRPRATGRWARFLADAEDVEQAADDVVQRGRTALGGAGELRGNGMVVRSDLLAALGGWPVGSLTEDLVLSSRLYFRTGHGAARPAGLEIWEQAPIEPGTMLRQRLRWAEGSVRRDLEVVVPSLVDGRIPLRRRADVAASTAQDLMPLFAIGILGGARRQTHARAAAEMAIGYGAAAVALALAAPEPGIPPGRRIAGLLVLGASWAVMLPLAWLRVVLARGDVLFGQTPHRPGRELEAPPFADVAAGLPSPSRELNLIGSAR